MAVVVSVLLWARPAGEDPLLEYENGLTLGFVTNRIGSLLTRRGA